MSIFFGASPSITMKRTETSRTGFCLLEGIRNRGCSKIKRGAPAAVLASEGLNSVKKGRREGHVLPRCHIVSTALAGWSGPAGRFAGAATPPMSDRQVHTHNVHTNANILHSIYICLWHSLYAYTHEIQILPVYTAIFSYIFTIVE